MKEEANVVALDRRGPNQWCGLPLHSLSDSCVIAVQEAEEAERQRLLEEERQEALRKLQEEEEAKRNKGKKGKGKKK